MENIITFVSVTNAMKAKELLRANGIFSRVIRTPARLRKGSCGYSLVVPKNFARAAELIKNSKIPYKGIFADDKQ